MFSQPILDTVCTIYYKLTLLQIPYFSLWQTIQIFVFKSHYSYTYCSNRVNNSYIDVPLPMSAFTDFVIMKYVPIRSEYIISTINFIKTLFLYGFLPLNYKLEYPKIVHLLYFATNYR